MVHHRASPEMSPSWPNEDGTTRKRLELAYRQLSAAVLEIPALFEYIDFRGPPDRLRIAKIGGYPAGPGMEPGKGSDIISHNLSFPGNSAWVMAWPGAEIPDNRLASTPRAPFSALVHRPTASHANRCTQKLRLSAKLSAKTDGMPA